MTELSTNESFNLILLQAAGGEVNPIVNYGMLILIAAVFYLFFIRPQSKRTKEQKSFIDNLQKGDEIVTSSGIFGKINKIDDDIVTLQVDTKTFIRITKGAVSKELTEGAKSGTTNESANKS